MARKWELLLSVDGVLGMAHRSGRSALSELDFFLSECLDIANNNATEPANPWARKN